MEMQYTYKKCMERIISDLQQNYGSIAIHGEHINDAGELIIDIGFTRIRDAAEWADAIRDSWGLEAEIVSKEPITSFEQTVLIAVRVTDEQAFNMLTSKKEED